MFIRVQRLLILVCIVCASAASSLAADSPGKPYLLHLPGIGGHMRIDDMLMAGLKLGGVDAEVQIYDWTGGNTGMAALVGYEHNQLESEQIARLIVEQYRRDPARRIIVTAHSGGAGLAVWALERLPEDVHVDTLLLLAPALSPQYDLTRALRHIHGKLYYLSSLNDPILGLGTRSFGTIDRVKSDSAGRVGFSIPRSADLAEYGKVIGLAYNSAWIRYGNIGDHIGAMSRPFARAVLAPLLLRGELPVAISPATAPATQASNN